MSWLNEYEIQNLGNLFDAEETPNLQRGAQILARLADWTNSNSDGWPYWVKPSRAASRLSEALVLASRDYYRGARVADISEADLRALCRPIKSFLTRQGANHSEVF